MPVYRQMDINLWLRDWGEIPLTRHETLLLLPHGDWPPKTCAGMVLKLRARREVV
jgi:hypothetical protein